MEKKESTTSNPTGMCEKLFNAFNPAFRPHRRLTIHGQEPEATTNPSPIQPNHSWDSGIKDAVKPRPPPPDMKKPSEAHAPKAELKPTAPPPSTSVPVRKVPDKLVLTSAPPKAAATPQPAPPGGEGEAESSKKNINDKVEDYIQRAKRRIRSISGLGRTPTP